MATIYCTFGIDDLAPDARATLERSADEHDATLRFSSVEGWSNLSAGPTDPAMSTADIVFGQPEPRALVEGAARWVQLTSAGYARYQPSRDAIAKASVRLTTSSSVYADPCAEHLLGMMLSLGRRLLALYDDQSNRTWRAHERRAESRLLRGREVLLLGYGAIARRLSQLLEPFEVEVVAVRRRAREDEPIRIVAADDEASLLHALSRADHVVSTLPGGDDTNRFMNATRFAAMKPSARFYNIGRGSTVDQTALTAALDAGQLDAAYLDVTDPEPLPPEHPLWSAPRCFVTPHTAGGRDTERHELVRHFVANLARFARNEPLVDRVI